MEKIQFYIIIGALILGSCRNESSVKVAPNVDHIETEKVHFVRYDRLVASMDTSDIILAYNSLSDKYPIMTSLYFNELLNFKSVPKDSFYYYIEDFLKAAPMLSLQASVEQVFPNTKMIEKDLEKAQKYLKYYFPELSMPNFYTYITEFGYQNIIFPDRDRDGIGIGLDMYLGSDFDYKRVDPKNPIFSDYLTQNYNKEFIVRNTLDVYFSDIIGQPRGRRMLDQMLHKGKRLYIIEKLIPWVADSIIMEYSASEMKWVEDNELQIWDFFLEKNLIYESNHLNINKYLQASPHSPGMPTEAPGRTATYIGLQIIRSYMKRNQKTTLQALIANTESQKILELSRYKPKRG